MLPAERTETCSDPCGRRSRQSLGTGHSAKTAPEDAVLACNLGKVLDVLDLHPGPQVPDNLLSQSGTCSHGKEERFKSAEVSDQDLVADKKGVYPGIKGEDLIGIGQSVLVHERGDATSAQLFYRIQPPYGDGPLALLGAEDYGVAMDAGVGAGLANSGKANLLRQGSTIDRRRERASL